MSTTVGRLNIEIFVEKNSKINMKKFEIFTFVILIFDGAGGEPGKQVLNAAASLHGP